MHASSQDASAPDREPVGPVLKLEELAPLESFIAEGRHSFRLLPSMEQSLRAIFESIRAAQRRVDVETYILSDDTLGNLLLDELARAARRGAKVRLLYDPLGCHTTPETFFERVASTGVEVRAYRRPDLGTLGDKLFPRDHCRIILTDRSAFTGGAAWNDKWLPCNLGGEGWHDVCSQIEGPGVEDVERVFEGRWHEASGAADGTHQLGTAGKYVELEIVADTPLRRGLVYERYREAIRRASHRVYIENAYFFPPRELLDDLAAAVRRGVEVQVVVPKRSDLAIIARAARARYESWIRAGLRIFEYEPVMTHAKFALVDDDWATVGTFNVNATSICLVNELNFIFKGRAFNARVADLFERDRQRCRELVVPPSPIGWDGLLDEANAQALLAFERAFCGTAR
jgi:cardiolipin synthase